MNEEHEDHDIEIVSKEKMGTKNDSSTRILIIILNASVEIDNPKNYIYVISHQ